MSSENKDVTVTEVEEVVEEPTVVEVVEDPTVEEVTEQNTPSGNKKTGETTRLEGKEGSVLREDGEQEEDEYSEDDLELDVGVARNYKEKGNNMFKKGEFQNALEAYTEAILHCPDDEKKDKAVFYSNRAAAFIMLEKYQNALDDCDWALDFDPNFTKAYLRRARAHERLGNPVAALEEYKTVLELDPKHRVALEMTEKLRPQAEAKQKEQMNEMLGKLKTLGNTVLGKFGLSLDNFKATKDPKTGGYSINFNQ